MGRDTLSQESPASHIHSRKTRFLHATRPIQLHLDRPEVGVLDVPRLGYRATWLGQILWDLRCRAAGHHVCTWITRAVSVRVDPTGRGENCCRGAIDDSGAELSIYRVGSAPEVEPQDLSVP